MINQELKMLFERYVHRQKVLPQQIEGIEKLIRNFTDMLTHDLIRALYLNQLINTTNEIPDPLRQLKELLKTMPNLTDANLQTLKKNPITISQDLVAQLEKDAQFYHFSQQTSILNLQQSPSFETLKEMVTDIHVENIKQEYAHLSSAVPNDQSYHQYVQTFLSHVEKLQKSNVDLWKKQYSQLLEYLLPNMYRLTRRGEIGMELIELVKEVRLSFLSYITIITKDGEEFNTALKQGILISQIDLLYDFKQLDMNLFSALRKQQFSLIEQELKARSQVLTSLDRMIKSKWIDTPMAEEILKNSRSQKGMDILKNLEHFRIKKEVGQFIKIKSKGSPQESENIALLSAIMKQNQSILTLHKHLLQGENSLRVKEKIWNAENLYALLRKIAPQNQQGATISRVSKFKEKVLEPIKSNANSKASSDSESKNPVLTQMNKLRQKVVVGAQNMIEISQNKLSGEALFEELAKEKILFPETENYYHQQINLLRDRLKSGGLQQGEAEKIIAQWEQNLSSHLTLDTEILRVREQLKLSPHEFGFSSEENLYLHNPDVPPEKKLDYLKKCILKYEIIEQLFSRFEQDSRFDELNIKVQHPEVVYLMQDILTFDPFFFSPEQWKSFENMIRSIDVQRLESGREILLALVKSSLVPEMIEAIFGWGMMMIDNPKQKRLNDKIVKLLLSDDLFPDWKKFKTLEPNLNNVSFLLKMVKEEMAEHFDPQTKAIHHKLEQFGQPLEENQEQAEITQKDIEDFVNTLVTTEYATRFYKLFHYFEEIRNSTADLVTPPPHLKNPSEYLKEFDEIMNVNHYDQKLELLIDQAIEVFSEDSPLVEQGKSLYQALTDFEY